MDKQKYMPRLIDKKVETYLKTFGALCIEGPKWCGKTWTSAYHCKSEIARKPGRQFPEQAAC